MSNVVRVRCDGPPTCSVCSAQMAQQLLGEQPPREHEPVHWVLSMLGYDGYALRVWFEPIEDEL